MLLIPGIRTFSSSLALAGALAISACSSGSSSATGTGGGGATGSGTNAGGGSTTSTSSSGGTGGEKECPPGPGYKGGEATLAVGTVTATVVDAVTGKGVVGLDVFICGINICLAAVPTQNDGDVTAPGKGTELIAAALKYGDGIGFAKFAVPITSATMDFGALITAALPAKGETIEPGKALVSGGVTLTVPEGGTIIHDELLFDTPEKQQFRAVALPLDKAAATVDPKLGLLAVFGVGPLETVFCPSAAVEFANPDPVQLPAGTAVEFLVHGESAFQEWAPYSGWAKVSDGVVSADGMKISTVAEGGLPVLTTFGVRKKP